MTTVTRSNAPEAATASQVKGSNDEDVLVAATPNSQSQEETDPNRDQLKSSSQVTSDSQSETQSQSQSQANPAWLAHTSASPDKRPTTVAVEDGELEGEGTSGSLEFGDLPASDHAMYGGGPEESQTQLNTPPEESIPPVSLPGRKRQSLPPTPSSAKKQKQKQARREVTHPQNPAQDDSFGKGPTEATQERAARLKRERLNELASLAVGESAYGLDQRGLLAANGNVNSNGAVNEAVKAKVGATLNPAGRLGSPKRDHESTVQQAQYNGDKNAEISASKHLHQPSSPASEHSQTQQQEPESATQRDPAQSSVAVGQVIPSPSPVRQAHQKARMDSNQETSQSVPLAQVVRHLASPSQNSSRVQQTTLAPPTSFHNHQIPATSSPTADRSVVPDSEAADGTQTSSESCEQTQQESEMSPEKLQIPANRVAETASMATAATEVSSGTSGKRFMIPSGRALKRHKPLPDGQSVSWMGTRLPGMNPGTARLNASPSPPPPPPPAAAETSRQGAENARRASPLKRVVTRQAIAQRSESPTPNNHMHDSPDPIADIPADLEKGSSLVLTSLARPITNTYSKSSSRHSRSSTGLKNYNEDTSDEDEEGGRVRKKASATPVDNQDESYRPVAPTRSQPAKLAAKAVKGRRRSIQSATPGSVIPATPDSTSPAVKHHRVLGFWRGTKQWYPATIQSADETGYKLLYDDGTRLSGASVDDMRLLRLLPSDSLLWQTGRKADACYIREEWTGFNSTKETVGPKVYKDRACTNQIDNIPLSRCCIQPPKNLDKASTLTDRLLRQDLLKVAPAVTPKEPPPESPARSRYNARAASSVVSPVKRPSPVKRNTAFTASSLPAVFAGQAFLVSLKNSDDAQKHKLNIEKLGGTVLAEFSDLFPMPSSFERGRDSIRLSDKARYSSAFCVVDEPTSKPKFLCALAIGIPCLSWRYVEDMLIAETKLDWRSYLVSSGRSEQLGTWASQVINRDWTDGFCLNNLLDNDSVRRPLWGKRVAFCSSRRDNKYYPLFPFLLCALGATSVTVANSYAELEDRASVSIIVVKDDDARSGIDNFHGLIGTVESLKQTLITGGWQEP